MKKTSTKANSRQLLSLLLCIGLIIQSLIPSVYALPSIETGQDTHIATETSSDTTESDGESDKDGTEGEEVTEGEAGSESDEGQENEGPSKQAKDGYIYFDLSAGSVTLASSTYTGYIYSTTGSSTSKTTVTGTHSAENKYYVYQSSAENRAITGEVEGVLMLPNYAEIYHDGNQWAKYITNNTDIDAVIAAWDTEATERDSTENSVTVSASGTTVDLTIEDIWSTQNQHSTSRTTGGIAVTGATRANTKVTVRVLGDNRLYNIFYTTKQSTSSLTFTSGKGDGSEDGTLTVIGKQDEDSLNTHNNYKVKIAPNFWNSVIGGNDSSGSVYNLFFKGATVYAGSTPIDNCTAIGGGGNDMGNVIIDGGAITAVSHTTGTAIGGGIAHTSYGGTSDVHINGGRVFAYNFGQPAYKTVKNFGSGTPQEVIKAARHIAGTAIGGGSSIMKSGNQSAAKITITGGEVYAESLGGCAIGGGNSVNMTAGSAGIIISGGTVRAKSSGMQNYCKHDDGTAYHIYPSVAIGGGRGGITGDGGSAAVEISGNPNIITGSVGGGGTINPDGKTGYASVSVSGGTTSGQFVMAKGSDNACSFEMTGGLISNSHTNDEEYAKTLPNGGAVYMDDPKGTATISGGTIQGCSARQGGAVYMTDGIFAMSGTASITGCTASYDGGAVCIGDKATPASNAILNLLGGSITKNEAIGDGGGIALYGGAVNISGGEISLNNAVCNGGGAYVDGGNVSFSNGSILRNTASFNGGGICVNNGSIIMSGGKADNNTAGGDGGGIYVSSEGGDVAADILSGSVSGNTAAAHGGAVAVVGNKDGDERISVMIGVNEDHTALPFDHTHKEGEYTHTSCPVIKNNTASSKGGAVYLSGSTETYLDIYCVYEDENMASDGETEHNFIMMEGGNCNISSSQMVDGSFDKETSGYGNVHITGTAYIVGGNMYLWGNMKNPSTKNYFTVNILADENGYIGTFADYRTGVSKEEAPDDEEPEQEVYKLHYYENFKGSGKYKSIDIPAGQTVTISGTIYSHPGYKIIGWYTNPDGTGTEYQVNSVYDPSTFEATAENPFLIIYAKWEAHNYHIEFNPNVPEGTSYDGSMEDMSDLEFDRDYTLPLNEFSCVGYVFTGWNTKADGGGEDYADGATIKNLTEVKGDTVVLYALWDEHIEPEPDEEDPEEPVLHSYTYCVSGATLVRTCICGIENYASLSASDTTYNGSAQYKARVEYSSNDVSKVWEPVLVYPKEPVDAGEYEAYVEAEDGTRASVYYTIKQAEQPAPPVPEFAETKTNSVSTFSITPVADGHGETLYRLVYLAENEEKSSPWSEETTIVIPYSLTSYYVEVKYKGDNNYLESPVTATASVFYIGEAKIEVTKDDGISVNTVFGEDAAVNGVDIFYTLNEGVHKTSGFGAAVINKDGDADFAQIAISHDNEKEKFNVSHLPTKECVVKIHISGVRADAGVSAFAAEGQVFGEIDTHSASISRDSAFSVCFAISNFNTDDYAQPILEFSAALPEKTTVIMLEKTASETKYLYLELDGKMSSLALSDFTYMGTDDSFTAVCENAAYQFVVDFSKTDSGISGDSVTVCFTAQKNGDNDYIESLTAQKTVSLSDTTFSMSASTEGLSGDLELEFAREFAASRWEGRRAALVLVPNDTLPQDARLVLVDTSGTTVNTAEYYINADGKFILPIGYADSRTVTLTLKSDMFPQQQVQYSFDCGWIISDTASGSAPMCGDVAANTSLVLEKQAALPASIRVSSRDNGKTLYKLGETINVAVEFENITDELEVRATMMYKNENGVYESFGLTQKVLQQGVVSMPLSADTPGNFCILIEVENTKGYTVMQTPYYFIVQR